MVYPSLQVHNMDKLPRIEREVECPRCGAHPGDACHSELGGITGMHMARQRAAARYARVLLLIAGIGGSS